MKRHARNDLIPRTAPIWALAAIVVVVVAGSVEIIAEVPADTLDSGLIIAVSGKTVIHRDGQDIPADVGRQLKQGDTVVVQLGGRCVGYTPGGQRFELEGPGELVLEQADSTSLLGGVTSWIRDQFARWIGESRRQPLIMRMARDWAFEASMPLPLVPGREGRVRSRGVHLRWATIPGVDRYMVTVARDTGDETARTVRAGSLHLDDLQPGAAYVWKVVPAVEGWPGDGAWRAFTVMTRQEEAELEQNLRDLGDLEAGVILLSVGLHEEAIAHLDAAVAGERDAHSARLWRAHAWAELGLHKQAYEDLLRARSLE